MANNDTSRRANSGVRGSIDSVSKILNEEAGMSPETSRKLAKQLLEVLKQQEQEHRKIVSDLSEIERIQSRYLGDNEKLAKVFGEQSADLELQIEQLQKRISNSKIGSDTEQELTNRLKQKEQILKEVNKARQESLSHLSTEQQEESNLYQIAYKRSAEEENRLETLRRQKKEIDLQIEQLKKKDKLSDKEKKQLKDLEKKKQDNTKEQKELVSDDKKKPFKGLIDEESKLGSSILAGKQAGESLSGITDKFGGVIGGALNKLGSTLAGVGQAISAGLDKLNNYVESATSFLADTKGNVNALLRGAAKINSDQKKGNDYFSVFLARSEEYLAAGTLITQQEYLSAIKQIASQGVGISTGLETAALLTAVAEKTVPQFNATNESLRRMVRLGETQATQRFFGLEAIILKSLNSQFGDTSYLNQLFDSVNQTMMDAVTNLKGADIGGSYEFRSTLQQWMSALYEQGVDNSTINRITTAINALGSGNVSAMSSDAGMQKLILLSLDKAGQDFATVLQEGLSANMLHTIMTSMTGYLKNLVGKTENNNVLEAAYANLFGLSMTDMYAFGNTVNAPKLNNVNNELTQTSKILASVSSDAYTILSEKIDNALTNMQFTFGQEIGNDSLAYGVWKAGNFAVDIGKSLGGIVGKGIEVAGRAALVIDSVPALAKTIYHTLKGGLDYLQNNENSVQRLYEAVTTGTASSAQNSAYDTGGQAFKSIRKDGLAGEAAEMEKAQEDYEKEQEEFEDADEQNTKILKQLEKTFMKDKEGKMAVAVSLEGLADEVLKSFASIFADEDSMEDVFKTKDEKNKLFKYDGETTSGDDKEDDKKK